MSGVLISISGASGVGKSAIVKDIFTHLPTQYSKAVSTTTRSPRAGEVEGIAYHFVSRVEFYARWDAGKFLERVEYNGKLYGIERKAVQDVLDKGLNALLIVEPYGAKQIREKWRGPLLQLFIRPPSEEVLQERMAKRGDSPESIETRRRIDSHLFQEHSFPYDAIFTNRRIGATADAIVQFVFASLETPLY